MLCLRSRGLSARLYVISFDNTKRRIGSSRSRGVGVRMVSKVFSLWALVSHTAIEIGLLVGSLLLVIGLLLLIPRAERPSHKPHLRSRSGPTKGALPGRRILSEEARVSRRFLSVPRITILNQRQGEQPQSSPTSAATITDASGVVLAGSRDDAVSPVVASLSAEAASQLMVQDAPSAESASSMEAPPTLAALADMPTLETRHQGREPITVILPETVNAREEREQQAGSWREDDLRMAETYNAVMQGRITDLSEIRQVVLEFEAIVGDPERLKASSWDVVAALFQLHQRLELLEHQAPLASPASDEHKTDALKEASAADPSTLEVETEPALVFPITPGGSAVDAPPAPAERETSPAEPTFIRKARLSSILTETHPTAQAQAAQIQETPALSAPAHPVRRARLTGFPPPVAHVAGDAVQAAPQEAESAEQVAAPAQSQQDDQAEVAPETAEVLISDSQEEEVAAPAPAALAPAIASVPTQETPLVEVICFGTVDILAGGKSLCPLESRFRSSREFELMTFLAHWAATHRQAFVDRGMITEALLAEEYDEDDEDEEGRDGRGGMAGSQRSPLGGWKYRLCRRLRQAGILDQAWLETRADGALRLRPEVRIDLVEFLHVTSQLRKVRDQLRRPGHKPIAHETILEWLQQLHSLYRERGEFAEQFLLCEWTQEPRRRYRSFYWHSLWYAAELLAATGDRPRAIQLAEELIEGNQVEAEPIFEALLTWLSEEGNKPDLLKWWNHYREWYAEMYPGQSLETARPDLVKLLEKILQTFGKRISR